MSLGYVLDTSALLPLLRGKELGDSLDRTFGLRAIPYMQTLSIVTHAEIWVLIERNGWKDERRLEVEKALQEFVTIDVSGSQIVAAYRKVEALSVGISMGKNDVWIAATAMVTELPLITTDKDFNHLNGRLLEVHYVDPASVRVLRNDIQNAE